MATRGRDIIGLRPVPDTSTLSPKNTTVAHGSTYPTTQLTAAAGANVYGNYAQLTAALGYEIEVYGILVTYTGLPGADANHQIAIATGDAGQEVDKIEVTSFIDVATGEDAPTFVITLPTPVKLANARIAGRSRSNVGSAAVNVALLYRRVS